MAQDILRLSSHIDFSLSLESVLDHNMVVEDTSILDFGMSLTSEIDETLPVESLLDLEERDPL